MIRRVSILFFVGLFIFGAAMTAIRMRLTEMAYRFEELKLSERGLKEEQIRLESEINKILAPNRISIAGFGEPEPFQVVQIP